MRIAKAVGNNTQRAALAGRWLKKFADHTGIREDGPETWLVDFLANAMHWADKRGLSWEECLNRADHHYTDEVNEENEP